MYSSFTRAWKALNLELAVLCESRGIILPGDPLMLPRGCIVDAPEEEDDEDEDVPNNDEKFEREVQSRMQVMATVMAAKFITTHTSMLSPHAELGAKLDLCETKLADTRK